MKTTRLSSWIIFNILLSLYCSSTFAKPTNMAGALIPDQKTVEADQQRKTLNNLFTWINQLSNHSENFNPETVTEYFAPNITYVVNGKVLAKNSEDVSNRFNLLLTKNKEMHVVMPLDSVIIANNYAAITYQVKITNEANKTYLDHITALITFENGKIKTWDAVAAHE